ncbi:CBS domain-containing protein [Amphibacillus sediminis]|uniref:CBS domain-containing protein n=1 Tax=Amphibacillus sediminis TaxID=360185 RepID=UPI00082CA028|nr:CBS domain-containing protein [Amphibacillus sediminis]
MSNAERFIVAFNKIEQFFEQELNDAHYVPFVRAAQQLSQTNTVINRYLNDLLEFSELRNAIIHERTEIQYTIAEPHDQVVEAIEGMVEEITAPKRVIPTFQKTLTTLQIGLKLKDVLEVVNKTSYSQFPVYHNKDFVGLLTDKMILHWIATQMEQNFSNLFQMPLAEVISQDNESANYRFINKDTNIYQAEDLFISSMKQHERLDALLITEDGKQNQPLLGMISPNDLIEIP